MSDYAAFLDRRRQLDTDAGFEPVWMPEFLFGFRGRLFSVAADYAVGETIDGYDAVGSGYIAACGALCATEGLLEPGPRILAALKAAERHSMGVAGPALIIDLPR